MGGEKVKTALKRVLGLYRSTKPTIKYGAWTLSVVAVLALGYLLFSLSYLDRVYPNVVIGTSQFQGLTQDQLKDKLNQLATAQVDQKITLQQGDNTLEFDSKEVDWQVNIEATANQVFRYGREDGSR